MCQEDTEKRHRYAHPRGGRRGKWPTRLIGAYPPALGINGRAAGLIPSAAKSENGGKRFSTDRLTSHTGLNLLVGCADLETPLD